MILNNSIILLLSILIGLAVITLLLVGYTVWRDWQFRRDNDASFPEPEVCIDAWAVRNPCGRIYIFKEKPVLVDRVWYCRDAGNTGMFILGCGCFPQVKTGDAPEKVSVSIDPELPF